MPKTVIRSFTDVLGLLNRGHFAEQCDQALADAIETLGNQPNEKGKGKITVELSISYVGGRVDITPSIKAKLPQVAFTDTPFWAHAEGLSITHPNQMDMFTRDAEERRGAATA